MNRNTNNAPVTFIGFAGIIAGISISPPLLQTLMGIELSSRSANAIAWAMTLLIVAAGAILIVKRQHITLKNVVSKLVYVLFLVALIEGVLQIAAWTTPRLDFILSNLPPYIEDTTLGYRLSPLHPEHDERGFRNATVPETSYLIAVGDSQTYGDNASSENAYPAKLGQMLGKHSYNMAAGGYSPPQYLELFKQAIDFKPQIVIVGLYSGNDLQESYWVTYLDKKAKALMSTDPVLIDALYEQERLKPTDRIIKNFEGHRDLFKLPNILRASLRVLVSTFEPMEQHWELYKQQAIHNNEFVLETNSQRTIFTPHKRFAALDLSDIRVKEGLSISLDSLSRMKKIATQESVTFLVLLIPTKELVYSDIVFRLKDYPIPEIFHNLIKTETEVWSQIKAVLNRKDITYLDTLPHLRQALNAGERIYSPNSNGHPESEGYRIIASTIAGWVEAHNTED